MASPIFTVATGFATVTAQVAVLFSPVIPSVTSAVIVASPAVMAVTVPSEETEAICSLLLFHETETFPFALAGYIVAVSCFSSPDDKEISSSERVTESTP